MATPDLIAEPGDPEADSYLTLDEAGKMAEMAGMHPWNAADEETRKAALRRAALDIDSHRFHDPEPYSAEQARVFPRMRDRGLIPPAVKWAAMFQAEFLLAAGLQDRGKWEGPAGAPGRGDRIGSPLCPLAFRTLAAFISKASGYGERGYRAADVRDAA